MNVGKDYANFGLTSEVEIKTSNVVCAADLGCQFDLLYIAKSASNVTYNPCKITCAIIRNRKIGLGKCVALIFRRGYICVNGNSNVRDARKHLRQFARLLQKKWGYGVTLNTIHILSMSAFAHLPKICKPDMDYVVKCLGGQYEPELMNSACIKKNGLCMLVFHSGGLVFTVLKFGKGHRKLVHSLIDTIIMNGISP